MTASQKATNMMMFPIQLLHSHDILILLDNHLKPLEDIEIIGWIMPISFMAIIGKILGSKAYLIDSMNTATVSIDLQSQNDTI